VFFVHEEGNTADGLISPPKNRFFPFSDVWNACSLAATP